MLAQPRVLSVTRGLTGDPLLGQEQYSRPRHFGTLVPGEATGLAQNSNNILISLDFFHNHPHVP
jgi:hypothetical protein